MNADVPKAFRMASVQDRFQVREMSVYASVADQSEQVQGFLFFFRMLEGFQEGLVGSKGTVAYGYMDSLQFLVYDAAGSEIEVPYFRVTHLSLREPDRLSAGYQGRVGIAVVKGVGEGSMCVPDGIGRGYAADAPTVHDHEQYFSGGFHRSSGYRPVGRSTGKITPNSAISGLLI